MRLYIADSSGGLSGIVLRWYRRFLVCVIFLQSVHLSGFLCICLSFTYFSHFIYLFIYLFIIHLTTPSLSDCVLCMLYTSMSLRYQVQWVGLMIPVTLVAHHVPSLTSGTEWVNTGSAVCYCESWCVHWVETRLRRYKERACGIFINDALLSLLRHGFVAGPGHVRLWFTVRHCYSPPVTPTPISTPPPTPPPRVLRYYPVSSVLPLLRTLFHINTTVITGLMGSG